MEDYGIQFLSEILKSNYIIQYYVRHKLCLYLDHKYQREVNPPEKSCYFCKFFCVHSYSSKDAKEVLSDEHCAKPVRIIKCENPYVIFICDFKDIQYCRKNEKKWIPPSAFQTNHQSQKQEQVEYKYQLFHTSLLPRGKVGAKRVGKQRETKYSIWNIKGKLPSRKGAQRPEIPRMI